MRGSYFLILELKRDKKIKNWKLRKGFYLYVGSGMKGLENRVLRHLRKRKRKFWHIDYLTSDKDCKPIFVILRLESEKKECKYARKFIEFANGIKGFGCSDCNCYSHLFYFRELNSCMEAVSKVLKDEN